MKYYCGVGSRETPIPIQKEMSLLAQDLYRLGYTLRSGNARGADQAFATGCHDKGQIWLPWDDFELAFQKVHPECDYVLIGDDKEAIESVEKFHPAYHKMKEGDPKKFETFMSFMTRNYRQVKGIDEPDSSFVVCWTKEGKPIGGTAQAMRIASFFNIPIFNFSHLDRFEILKEVAKLEMLLGD